MATTHTLPPIRQLPPPPGRLYREEGPDCPHCGDGTALVRDPLGKITGFECTHCQEGFPIQ